MKQVGMSDDTNRLLSEISDSRKASGHLIASKKSIVAELIKKEANKTKRAVS